MIEEKTNNSTEQGKYQNWFWMGFVGTIVCAIITVTSVAANL